MADWTYKDAGVDIEEGEALVGRIGPAARSTLRPEVLGGLGGFGAAVRVPVERYREPVLISGADGVGTKLLLAQQVRRHREVGIDLVAMCVNDILTVGAEPLYFLDYFATGRLDNATAAELIEGVAEGCRQAGCALVGGETAELPGMYPAGKYDVAGFGVGIVERAEMCSPARVHAGDVAIGLPSAGLHSNGFSLVRRILADLGLGPESPRPGGGSLADWLLEPTRIYVQTVLELLANVGVRAMAHVTGGGIEGNVGRALPDHLDVALDLRPLELPPVFRWLLDLGLDRAEANRALNMGLGFVLFVAPEEADAAIRVLRAREPGAVVIGVAEAGAGRAHLAHGASG